MREKDILELMKVRSKLMDITISLFKLDDGECATISELAITIDNIQMDINDKLQKEEKK